MMINDFQHIFMMAKCTIAPLFDLIEFNDDGLEGNAFVIPIKRTITVH